MPTEHGMPAEAGDEPLRPGKTGTAEPTLPSEPKGLILSHKSDNI